MSWHCTDEQRKWLFITKIERWGQAKSDKETGRQADREREKERDASMQPYVVTIAHL